MPARFGGSAPPRGGRPAHRASRHPSSSKLSLGREPNPSSARGLRPELVPGVEVFVVLSAVNDLAVLELEDDADADVEALAVSLPRAALKADHAAVLGCEQLLDLGPEGAVGLLADLAEEAERRVAALVVLA